MPDLADYLKALNELKGEGAIPERCELRQVRYLNNIIERDHGFFKRLVKPGPGFFSFQATWQTLQGYEVTLPCMDHLPQDLYPE